MSSTKTWEEELACIETLRSLESRYTNEAIGWALIVLTVLITWPGFIKLRNLCDSLLYMIVNGGFAFLTYFSLMGLFSAYLSARLVGGVISGHTALPKLTASILYMEVDNSNAIYCKRSPLQDAKAYLSGIISRASRPHVRCIEREIARYILPLKRMLRKVRPEISEDISYITSGKIIWTLESSGIFEGIRYKVALVLLLAIVILTSVISVSLRSLLYYEALAEILLTLGFIGYVGYLSMSRHKCVPVEEIDRKFEDDKLDEEAIRGLDTGLHPYMNNMNKMLSHASKFRCSLGIDKASLCCLAGNTHYCPVSGSIVAPTLVPSLLLTLSIYTLMLLNTLY